MLGPRPWSFGAIARDTTAQEPAVPHSRSSRNLSERDARRAFQLGIPFRPMRELTRNHKKDLGFGISFLFPGSEKNETSGVL